MRAVVIHEFGDAEVLQLEQLPDPEPGPGQALVEVAAVEVSRTRDVATRSGRHPFSRQVTLPHVLGGDFAGTVVGVGPGADPELIGRRVVAANTETCGRCEDCLTGNQPRCTHLTMLGIHRQGSYAGLAVVSTKALREIPEAIPMPVAAALAADGPIAFAQLALGGVGPGTRVLVTGATGALGTTLAALAAELGAEVVGIARRPAAIPAALELRARLDATDTELAARLLELGGGEGISVAIDNVADPDAFGRYFDALSNGARVVFSGAIGNPELPVLRVPAAPLYLRSLSLLGLRTASPEAADAFWEMVAGGFRLPDGLIEELPLQEAATAHRRIAESSHVGHTVLVP